MGARGATGLKRWTDELKRGDQIANLYRSEVEQAKVVLDLLRWMGEGDKLVLLTDHWDKPVFRHAILEAAMEEDRLRTLPSCSIMCASGRFDPDAFFLYLAQEAALVREAGYRHAVLMWEADWAARSEEEARSVVEFGARLALAPLPGEPTVVAQYCTGAFSPQQAQMQRRSNQLVLEASSLERKFWVVSTSSFSSRMKGEANIAANEDVQS